MPEINENGIENTTTDVKYQWRTSRGAATQEFTDIKLAREWMETNLRGPHARFYTTLTLYKITTTKVTDAIYTP